ncbi:MAG: putative dehydrogenase [Chthoniobacteraceae bacterium]|nr:putative dehydrogenase [Chthoniobacteraceae bacterium]
MQLPPIRIGIVGSGRAGMIHARNFSRLVAGARVVAISDPIAEARHAAIQELGEVAGYGEYQALLEDRNVDAILIAAPTALHREIAVSAAREGKHVFCEKPMAMNPEECDAMIEATNKAGVVLQIGFMRRFDAGFRSAYERVQAGEIGEVVLVKSCTHGPTYPKPWMFDLAQSNGPLAEVCSHDIDTVRWFTGSEFAEVYAIAGNYRTPEARESHPDFYDQVLLSARFANGSQGCITGAQGVQYAYDSRVEIIGTHGLISIGGLNAGTTFICTRDKELRRPAVVSWTGLYRDAYLAEDIEFIAAIREGRQACVTGRDGRAAVAVVNAGNRSIIERKIVPLN